MRFLVVLLLLASFGVCAEPRLRPDSWATPVIGTQLQNMYRVDEGVFRSEQPDDENIEALRSLGIREILNLRAFHSDDDEMAGAGFMLRRVEMDAGDVTEAEIIRSLRIIQHRKGPVLVHCWHGSDRTGVTIAAYRIIFNNWTKAQALDEMINGGYGYHSTVYPNLIDFIRKLDVDGIRNALGRSVDQARRLRRKDAGE